ncbi:siphovirus Gp157 family protein [Fructilactobacillus sp. Tb1]|uniref:siphovirus Gp157 family protein n=1 Tax=Fructilactobacillus sp. Tb1 TaxID=3422304 RepID=UPI003D26C62D
MASLYEITDLYKKIDAISDDPEVLKDTLDSLDFEDIVKNKFDGYASFVNSLEADNDSIDKETKRISSIKKHNTNLIKQLKERLSYAMQTMNKEKIETSFHKAGFRPSKAVEITDESLIPSEYFITPTPKANKTAIKKAIQSGVVLRGAKIVERENLSLR